MVALKIQPKVGTFPSGENLKKGYPDGTRLDRQEATEAKRMAHEALKELREAVSFDNPETARDNALAMASAFKSWQIARMEWRFAYGRAVPGSQKPPPMTEKKSKPKLRPGPKAPERPPAPVAEVPSIVVSSLPPEPPPPTGSAQAKLSK